MFILNLLMFTILYMVVGVMGYGWYLPEICALFMALGVAAGFSAGYSADSISKEFIAGAKDIFSAALVIGFAAGIIVILKDGQVIDRMLASMASALDEAGRAGALGSMYGIQTFINIAMCLRIGPVIGITLPFFSAGGSANLSLYIGLGLIFSIYRSVYSQTQETNFRLIGVRSPFQDTFHDNASYKNHTKDHSSNSGSKREIEQTRGRLGNDGLSKREAKKLRKEREAQKKAAQKEAERVQKARAKAQKKAAKKKKKAQPAQSDRSSHSATYMKKHKDD